MADNHPVSVGDKVLFTGFQSQDQPDNAELLEEGVEYEVAAINEPEEDGDLPSYDLLVPNPDFDGKKKASKKNPEYISVDVFADEFELPDEEEEDGEEEESGEEEEQPAARGKGKGKAAAKGKAKAEAKPKAKGKAKSEEEIKPKGKAAAKGKGKAEDKPAKAKGKAAGKAKAREEEAEEVDPELKDLIILSEDEEDEEILALVNEADDLCELAHDVSEEAAATEYRLGGVLYHVRVTGAHKALDDRYAQRGGFGLYVEEQLGVKYRKAMYLIDIYAKFNKYGIPANKVAELGWTKSQEIARVMDEENAEELVGIAGENTYEDLKDTIRESYSTKGGKSDPGEKVKRVTLKFRLLEDDGATVRQYFEQAKQALGLDDDNKVFEHIVTEWATENLDVKKSRGKGKTAGKGKKAA